MPSTTLALIEDRGVAAVTGADALKLLQGILTNDVDLLATRPSIAAGLLSPQGKILFDLIVHRSPEGALIEVATDKLPAFLQRLTLYKLRADARIADVSTDWIVVAAWGGDPIVWPEGTLTGPDPRRDDMGVRALVPTARRHELPEAAPAATYHARRVALGVPEGGSDFVIGDTFPHEANYDLRGGVSFTKGCYVGQEVVARMHHKTVVRKRIVRIRSDGALTSGADIAAGSQVIGRVGTVAGSEALAYLKLDRAEELAAKGETLMSEGRHVAIDPADLAEFAARAAAKANRT